MAHAETTNAAAPTTVRRRSIKRGCGRDALRTAEEARARYLIGAPAGCAELMGGGVEEDAAAEGALSATAGGAATLAAIGAGLATTSAGLFAIRAGFGLTAGRGEGTREAPGDGLGEALGTGFATTRGAAFDGALTAGDLIGAGAGVAIDFAAVSPAWLTASRHNAMPPSSPSSLLMIFTFAGSLKFTSRLLPPPIYRRS